MPRPRARLVASPCEASRPSSINNAVEVLDVKDLMSQLVHLSLSLRMSGHMKQFRACMCTVMELKLALLQSAFGAEAADYRSHILELFLARGQLFAMRRSLVGVVQRRLAKQECEPRRSFRADAVMHFSASGECVLLSPRDKATVRVPSPSVDGLRPRLRQGRLVALRPQCLARQLSGFPGVVWFQARPTFSCQRQGHLRPGLPDCPIQLCSASKVAVMVRMRMAMTTAMAARRRDPTSKKKKGCEICMGHFLSASSLWGCTAYS